MISLFILILVPGISFANSGSDDTITTMEAKKAALYHVLVDLNANPDSPWHHQLVKGKDPIPVYDTSDTVCSYIVNLTANNKPVGFIEISSTKDQFPVLSFGYDGSKMDSVETDELRKIASGKKP